MQDEEKNDNKLKEKFSDLKERFLNKELISNILIILLFLLATIFGIITICNEIEDTNRSIIRYATNYVRIIDTNIYCIFLTILAFLSFVPLILDAIFLIVKKKRTFTLFDSIYHIAFPFLVLLFQVLYSKSDMGITVFSIFGVIFSMAASALHIITKPNKERDEEIIEESEEIDPKSLSRSRIVSLVLSIIGLLIVVLTLFLPLYITEEEAIILVAKAFDFTNLIHVLLFLSDLIMIMISVLFLADTISYFNNKKKYIEKTKGLLNSYLVLTIIYFFMGFIMTFYQSFIGNGEVSIGTYTTAYLPMILIAILILVHSFFRSGIEDDEIEDTKPNKNRVLTLVLVCLISFVTYFTLALNVIKITFDSEIYTESIKLTGFELLTTYQTLGAGFQVIAFLIVVMLIATSVGLLLTLVSFFSKSTYFKVVSRLSVAISLFFTFMMSISGLYFSIANKLNEEIIKGFIANYIESNSNAEILSYLLDTAMLEWPEYKITTDLVFALILDLIFVMIVVGKKVIDKTEYNQILIEGATSNSSKSKGESELIPDTSKFDFDSCPAFSELDSNKAMYQKDLKERKLRIEESYNLSDFCEYVVTYARDSRLHLSYTKETIASFVSGLGSTKLSILQGMSGTGKTSLPKIFSEAISGNCDVIEVESSWKDKNELLGYYNEFTEKFTPKKFTQALYKASLNPEIITFIVLDEMNLSRIEYYFSDFLSLMEHEEGKRFIKLTNVKLHKEGENSEYSALLYGHTLPIPKNVWFVGTANRDESTFVISDKVYDRAYTMNFNKRALKVRNYKEEKEPKFFTYETFNNLLEKAKKGNSFDAEKNEVIKAVELILEPYNISFGNRILNQIESFVNIYNACFLDEDKTFEAVETILLSKVVSKLEVKIIENKDKLMKDFEKLKLFKCKEFISTLNED